MKWVVESSPTAVTRQTRWSGARQEEALHRIWYALRRWRLVSRQIVLFPMMACSSINRI
ncbi:unnamed protein product [Spirodela intermedia]|uniref:Uncharacterized protein n=1 Tax=Spirodela intermedia TaxID=51605 RepID=A0A7I8J920_SPIIN|nr:unnamed protein product [Spirodela intermedia]CAA6665923.1 unnamed protein product [Spirodela intermedia]